MDNTINFKGAFLVKQPTPELRNSIYSVIEKKKKQIIENVTKEGDVLYVHRNINQDKDVANIILNTKYVKFKYYPSLSTKSGFDDQKPQDAKKILRTASNTFIDTKYKLENFFKPKPKKPFDIVRLQANNLKVIEKETFINITGSNYRTNIDHQSGICSVYTMVKNTTGKNTRHTLINITPPDKYGISYARINPAQNDSNSCMRRLAIKNNEIIFEYTEPGSEVFIKNEAAAKKNYLDIMNRYKENLV